MKKELLMIVFGLLILPALFFADFKDKIDTIIILRLSEKLKLKKKKAIIFLPAYKKMLKKERLFFKTWKKKLKHLEKIMKGKKNKFITAEVDRLLVYRKSHYLNREKRTVYLLKMLPPKKRALFLIEIEKINKEIEDIIIEVKSSRLPKALRRR